MTMILRSLAAAVLLAGMANAAPVVDEKAGQPGEYGFRPVERSQAETNPPGFVWRPQKDAVTYELELAGDAQFMKVILREEKLAYNVYCPAKTLPAGTLYWRFRFTDKKKQVSAWSQARSVEIARDAIVFPMPPQEELIGRIPKQHPRLFVRPEEMANLRQRAQGDLKPLYEQMAKDCAKIVQTPPDTTEPPKYPEGMKTKSDEWMKIWWGNRTQTIKVLDSAATLGFVYRLDGNKEFGQLGKKILMEACKWDPKGATNYRYNDEAGMPYVYYFARAYTFLNDLLSEQDKEQCRAMMAIRGAEMYKHLRGKMFWTPYESHANRGWHKLTEAGIAFMDEIPEAKEWVWFGMNYFYNVYPVWSDADGGWHEGASYWESYIRRFSFFADVMKSALKVDAFKKPYFSRAGYYAMYLQPPGTIGGGFGDLVNERNASANLTLLTTLAAQAQNPYWQWYVNQLLPAPKLDKNGKKISSVNPGQETGYIGFVRGAMPQVQAKAPDDLPASRVFRGIGQAYLNTNLKDGKENVALGFKSSPFGSSSHGYDSNNTFFLYAYGQRLLVPTGRRDCYGSEHHVQWMWETKSVNGVLVDGKGQGPRHSMAAKGQITGFSTSDWLDYVAGDASGNYGEALKRFDRKIVFIKPGLIVIWDRLDAAQASTFDFLLHAPVEIKAAGQEDVRIVNGGAQCRVSMLWPAGLELSVTDQYETPPRAKIKGPDGKPLKEWHFAAKTKAAQAADLVTLIRVGKAAQSLEGAQKVTATPAGLVVEASGADGAARVVLPKADGAAIDVTWTPTRGAAKHAELK